VLSRCSNFLEARIWGVEGCGLLDQVTVHSCGLLLGPSARLNLSSGIIPYRRERRSAVRCNCHRLHRNDGDLLARPNRARIGHGSGFCACLVSTSPAAGRGEPVPSATARPLPGTEDATSRPTPAAKFALIVLRPILPLAAGVVDRKTRHVCPLAPRRFSIVRHHQRPQIAGNPGSANGFRL